jgi:exosortase
MLAGSLELRAGTMRGWLNRKRTILLELALAAVVAGFVAVSPLTPNELPPSIAAGVLVGAVLLAWRLRPASPVWRSSAAGGARRVGRAELVALSTCALCLCAFAPTLQWMYREWTRSVWVNDHGLFVPPFMAWFAWTVLRDDDGPAESSAWGFLPLGSGLALAVLDAVAQTRYLAALGLLLVLPGLSLLLLGPRRTHALRVPLLLGLLLVPLPFTLATPLALRSITAIGSLELLHALGFTALREGTLILMPDQNFLVADACSGIATLYASLACAVMLASITASRWRRAVMLLVATPLAIGVNVLRVTLLVLMTQWLGRGLLDTPIHEATGVATFVIVIAALLSIAHGGRAGGAHAS